MLLVHEKEKNQEDNTRQKIKNEVIKMKMLHCNDRMLSN